MVGVQTIDEASSIADNSNSFPKNGVYGNVSPVTQIAKGSPEIRRMVATRFVDKFEVKFIRALRKIVRAGLAANTIREIINVNSHCGDIVKKTHSVIIYPMKRINYNII